MTDLRQKFAVRGTEGLFMYDNCGPEPKVVFQHQRTHPNGFRFMQFSRCGRYLVYCDGENTVVLQTSDNTPYFTMPLSETTAAYFSPQTKYLCTFQPYTTNGAVNKDAAQANPEAQRMRNLKIWSLETKQMVVEYSEKKQQNWYPKWSEDEMIFGRLQGTELQFYERGEFVRYTRKLVLPKLSDFTISMGRSPYHVAAYISVSNSPAAVRLFQYPDLQTPVSNRSFFKADRVSMIWNKRGSGLVVMAITDIDSTGKSYYGESNLYLVLTKGESFLLDLKKPGPVYHVDWHPNSLEFCVVYGYMPAKVTLYNIKGDALFSFGTGPRNEAHYSPIGNRLCLCGFGSLRGNIEIWMPKKTSKDEVDMDKTSQFVAEDTTLFEWAPDSQHFLTATTAPRLRVNNGFKIWHHSGVMVFEQKTSANQFLAEVAWQPMPNTEFPEVSVKDCPPLAAAKASTSSKAQASAYVPPHLRGMKNRPQFKLHENEPASNAEFNKDGTVKETNTPRPGEGDPEKRAKHLKKILDQIAVLKKKKSDGEKLETTQIAKIDREEEVIKELKALQCK